MLETSRCFAIRGEEGCRIAELACAENIYGVIQRARMNEAEDWTKNFCGVQITADLDIVKQGWGNEVTRSIFRDARIAPVQHKFCALLNSLPNQTFNARAALGRDDRAHAHVFVEPVANVE